MKGGAPLFWREKSMDKNFLKKGVAVAALAAIAIPLAGCSTNQPPQKVAVVDYQVLMQNHPDRKTAESDMMAAYQELQKKASEQQNDESISQEERMKSLNALQQELMTKETNLFTPIKDDVDKKIDEVMKEKGYSSVFSKDALIRGGDDITSDVLRKEGLSDDDIKTATEQKNPTDGAAQN